MKAPRETDLVRACLDYLQLRRIFAWRNNTQGVFDPSRRKWRTFTGLKGVADILGVLSGKEHPCGHGVFLAVETKLPGRRPTAEQQDFIDRVRAAGGVGLLVRSVQDLEDGLRELGYV